MTVFGQNIQKIDSNRYLIDSITLKDYASLHIESKYNIKKISILECTIDEVVFNSKYKDSKINKLFGIINNKDLMLKNSEDNRNDENKKYKSEINHYKRKTVISYIIGGSCIVLGILIAI